MIFCKSHSNCGQKIVFLDFQICFGQEDSPRGAFWHVSSMYRGSRLRSTLNTSYITGLDMCQVCTEAVDCVAL